MSILDANNLSRSESSANGFTFSCSIASLVMLLGIPCCILVSGLLVLQVAPSITLHLQESPEYGELSWWFVLPTGLLTALTTTWFLWNIEAQM